MKKKIMLWLMVLPLISLAQKKPPVKTDSTRFTNVVPTPTANNQSFPFLNVIPPSPQAASLGKYGEIPVSLSTGTASFEVPIYEVVAGSLKVPVKLSYHSAGVKVNDIASPVGTGWSLLAGGAISRTVRGGLWDECEYGILNQVIPEANDAANFNCFLGNLNTSTDYVDGMPDDFFYNFNGLSGKFIYNTRNTSNQNITPVPIAYPYTKLKIDWESHQNFRITDIDGTMYIFDVQEQTVLTQSTTARNNPCGTTYTSAWYLSKIISATRTDTIRFNYSSPVGITSSPIWSTTLTKNVNSFGAKLFSYAYAFQRTDINSIVLTDIEYKNGKVAFTYAGDREDVYDADNKRLTAVTIYKKELTGSLTELKHFSLNHSYFTCTDGRSQVDQPLLNVTGHPSSFLLKRLKLNSVTETAPNSTTIPPYQFDYYEEQALPIFASLAQDYWGYSNGAAANSNLLLWNTDPSLSAEPSATYGANCSPNFSYAVSGALKRITYPTGGFSDFLYESNTAVVGGSPVEGGGIRIKKIIHNNNQGDTTRTVYNYISSYLTNVMYDGVVYHNVFNFTTQVNAEDNVGGTNYCVIHANTIYPEKINVSLGSEASFVANEIVEEYQEDGSGNRLGKKRYAYSTALDQVFVDFPNEHISGSWKRGLLLNEKTYSILPSTSEVVIEEKQTTYTEYVQPYKTRGYFVRLNFDNDYYTGFCQIIGNKYCGKYSEHNSYIYAEKNEQSSVFLPTKVKTYSYDQSGLNPVVDSLFYEYNTSHLLLTKTKSQNSNAKIYETINRYPTDFSGNAVYDEMVTRHILSPIVETEYTENSVSLKKSKTSYKLWHSGTAFGSVSGFFAPLSVETQENGSTWYTEIMMGETLASPTQDGYDVQARPVLYTDRTNLTTQLEYWEVTGKRDLLKKKTALTHSTEFDYEPGIGIKKITAPNGVQSNFIYDVFGRLRQTKDHNSNILFEYDYTYGSPNKVSTKQYVIASTGINNSESSLPNYMITNAYLDGLGRPVQTVGMGLSPEGNDIIMAQQTYDVFGRVETQLATTPTGNQFGLYVNNGLELAQNYYKDLAPYTKVHYEVSSLSRPRNEFGLGYNWHSANKQVQTFDETAGTDVPLYLVDGSGNITFAGTYYPNCLFKKRIIDEQGNTTVVITDKKGQVIERQQQVGAQWLTTHYIYDGLGRTVAILQPTVCALNSSIAQGSTTWLGGVFFYSYDNRGRVIEKHVPNGGYTSMVYDKADRLVLTQDAHQHSLNLWSFTKYDGLSREVLLGEFLNANSRSTLQGLFDSHSTLSETFDGNTITQLYYSNASFPFSVDSSKVMEVKFYDAYADWRISVYEPYTTNYYTNAKGLQTGYFIRYTANRQWLTGSFYYDSKGRVTENKKQTIISIIPEFNITTYRLTGGIYSHIHGYQPQGSNTAGLYCISDYSFGRGERKTGYKLTLSGASFELNVRYDYNEIGQLKTKIFEPNRQYQINTAGLDYINRPPALDEPYTQDIANKAIIITPDFVADSTTKTYIAEIDTTHNNGLVDALQTINYDYNIRGQLKCVNCRNNQPYPNPKENDLFSMKLGFEEDKRYFDGNISYQLWKSPNVPKKQQYVYSYDAASRLVKSHYSGGQSGSNYSIDTVRYDANGNIQQLKRNTIDNLSYTYSGNQLLSVTDGSTNVGFLDGNTSGDDYEYWANGALKRDKNKGIDSVHYNSYLKKVSRIKFSNGNWINFYYDANGNLLRRKLSNGDVWTYRDDLIVKNDTEFQLRHDEGRLIYEPVGGNWLSEFEYRDIWGNLRVSLRDSSASPTGGVYKPPVVTQSNDFDAFGYEIGTFLSSPFKNNFKYQNQERISDFDLDVDWFKFRPSDPKIGRFWQIDPLSESYVFNSPYAFQENKFGLGTELEGMELKEFFTKVGDFMAGSNAAWSDNQLPGSTKIREVNSVGRNQVAYNAGQTFGDALSIMQGAAETLIGLGGGSAAVAATVASGGTLTPATAVVGMASVGVVVHGVSVGTKASANLSDRMVNSQGRANKDGNNKPTRNERAAEKKAKKGGNSSDSKYGGGAEHTSGTRSSTRETHEKGRARNAQDKGGEKADSRRYRTQDSKKTN